MDLWSVMRHRYALASAKKQEQKKNKKALRFAATLGRVEA
jgi:hypothetical protein